jgi:hypothetical protein
MQPAETTPKLSEGRRLSGVCFEPGAVFPDIAVNGRWWLALIIIVLLTTLSVTLMVNRIGYDQMIRSAFESNERAQQMSPEQRAQAIEAQKKFMPIAVKVMPVVAIFLGSLVVAGALLFTFKFLLDAEMTYKQVLNIYAYAAIPPSIVGTGVMLMVLYMKPPEEFDMQNASAISVGAFLPQGTSAWIKSLGASLDLFTIWTIVLLAIGFSAFCGAKRMPFGRALTGIVLPWLVYVAGKAAFASLFG